MSAELVIRTDGRTEAERAKAHTACVDDQVGAVVVFFDPDVSCHERANRLARYMRCVVVDNTNATASESEKLLDPSIEYIFLGCNEGIATALNRGVECLREAGCKVAMLFDQDSEPDESLLTGLPDAMRALMREDPQVALVGPAYVDERLGGVTPFVQFAMWRLRRVPVVGDKPLSVDFLISSGSCLNLSCWEAIGPLEDALFIDFVDLEWCIRARRKGFHLYGIPWIKMRHSLGGEPIRIFGRTYPSHSALRHYYLFRNSVSLILRHGVPWSWKSTELVKLPFRLCIYALFLKPRWGHVSMACRGIVDGLRGALGPFRGPSA